MFFNRYSAHQADSDEETILITVLRWDAALLNIPGTGMQCDFGLFLSFGASATIHTSTMNMQVGPCVFRVSVVYNDVTKHGSATITGTGPCANAGGSFHWLPVGPPTGPLEPVVDWNDLNGQYVVSGDINQIGQENVLAIFNEIAANPQY